MEERLNLYGLGVEWVGERPVSAMDKNHPDFERVHRIWLEEREGFAEPEEVERSGFTVTAVQRVRLLGEPVLAVLFYSLDEWVDRREPNRDYLFFMVGDRFLEDLELAKGWGYGR